jgi:hypothetical protein
LCCIISLLHGAFPAQPAANACRAIISTAPCLRFVTHWQRQFRTDSVSDISIKTPPNDYARGGLQMQTDSPSIRRQRLGNEQLAGHRQAAITAGDRLSKLAELPDNELALVGDLQWSGTNTTPRGTRLRPRVSMRVRIKPRLHLDTRLSLVATITLQPVPQKRHGALSQFSVPGIMACPPDCCRRTHSDLVRVMRSIVKTLIYVKTPHAQ